MARRAHSNINGEFGNTEFNSGAGEENNYYNYYGADHQSQENYIYQANFDYGTPQNNAYNSSATENSHGESYFDNSTSYYGDSTNLNSYNNIDQNYNYDQPSKTSISTSFPKVHTSPVINQPVTMGYGSQTSYIGKSDRSWISAFSSGGFNNEPPLLEGILKSLFDYV